jgi:DNA polymerase III sliding clamp (beta) subunit (PCNA family)
LKKTSFAAASTHFRQVFTGTLFDVSENNLTIVASDTHRLAYKALELEEPVPQDKQFTVPNRTIGELLRILADSDEPVKIGFIDNNVVFTLGDTYFTSRIIEGQYPNYNQVIPQNFVSELKIKPSLLIETLERALIIPTDDKSIKRVQLQIGPEEIQLIKSTDHHQNFLDCVRSRQLTITPCEVAHRSASVGHIGLISLRLGRKLRWDPEREHFIDDPEADRLLGRTMRAPYSI